MLNRTIQAILGYGRQDFDGGSQREAECAGREGVVWMLLDVDTEPNRVRSWCSGEREQVIDGVDNVFGGCLHHVDESTLDGGSVQGSRFLADASIDDDRPDRVISEVGVISVVDRDADPVVYEITEQYAMLVGAVLDQPSIWCVALKCMEQRVEMFSARLGRLEPLVLGLLSSSENVFQDFRAYVERCRSGCYRMTGWHRCRSAHEVSQPALMGRVYEGPVYSMGASHEHSSMVFVQRCQGIVVALSTHDGVSRRSRGRRDPQVSRFARACEFLARLVGGNCRVVDSGDDSSICWIADSVRRLRPGGERLGCLHNAQPAENGRVFREAQAHHVGQASSQRFGVMSDFIRRHWKPVGGRLQGRVWIVLLHTPQRLATTATP